MSDSWRRHSSLCTFKTMISLWTPILLLWTCPLPLCHPVSRSHPESSRINKILVFEKVDLFFLFFANRTKSAFFPPSFLITVGIEAKVGNTVNVIPWQGQRGKLSCSQETMAQFFFFWLFFPSWPVIGLRPPSPDLWTGWCPLSRTGDWTQDESERMRHLCQVALTFRSIFDSEITDHTWLTDRPGLGREWWGEVRGSSYPASIFNEVIPKKPCSDTERFIYSLAL